MTACCDRLRRDEIAATGCAGLAMTACCDRLRRSRNDGVLRPAALVAQ
ncbi:hypothetical protein [Roseiflexus castenholzii]|nr:hypothetical protein [Roseiflexus castenholzii]